MRRAVDDPSISNWLTCRLFYSQEKQNNNNKTFGFFINVKTTFIVLLLI